MIVISLASLAVVACASANKSALKEASAVSARSFAAGDYAEAIGLHRDLYAKAPGNGAVLASYVATVEDVKRAGDGARGRGNYVAAEGAYRALIAGWDGISAFAGKLTFKRADIEASLRDCRVARCEREFQKELRAGDPAKALGAYLAGFKQYPGDKSLRAAYARSVSEIRAIGAKALTAKDFALAGKINGLLLGNIASVEALGGPAERGAADTRELTEALRVCASGLTNRGLAEYRKGDLEKAIATWSDLLTFDPGNAEIKKAVETAKAQLARLRSSAPGKGSGRSGRKGQQPAR